jgi:hypothetical protein
MYDDPIGALEAELVAAARRRSAAAHGGRWRPTAGGVIAAAAAVLAAVVAVGAVALLGRHGGGAGRSGAPAHTYTATAKATPGTLHIERFVSSLLGEPPSLALSTSVEHQLGLNRYNASEFVTGVVTVPGGVRIRLWEFGVKPAHAASIDELVATVSGRVVARATAAQIRRRGLLLVYGYTSSGSRVAVLVPNDVAAVRLKPPRELAFVHHNLATFRLHGFRLVRSLGGAEIVWYGRHEHVLQRIGPEPLRP